MGGSDVYDVDDSDHGPLLRHLELAESSLSSVARHHNLATYRSQPSCAFFN